MSSNPTLSDVTGPTIYGPLPDTSYLTAMNAYFDVNLPLLEGSATAAERSRVGDTRGLSLPSITEQVQKLNAYVNRKDNRTLTDDELTAYAQLSVWHDMHAEALGGFYGSFTHARRALSALEHHAAEKFIDATSMQGTTNYTGEEAPITHWLEIPTDLVQAAKTCLRDRPAQGHSGQVIYLGDGNVRRQSSYDAASTAPADAVDSAPSDMCINYFATKDDDLAKVYVSQVHYLSELDRYSRAMLPITNLRESVRKTTQPEYQSRFADMYDHDPAIKQQKQDVLHEWVRRGHFVEGHRYVVLPSEDPEVDAGAI